MGKNTLWNILKKIEEKYDWKLPLSFKVYLHEYGFVHFYGECSSFGFFPQHNDCDDILQWIKKENQTTYRMKFSDRVIPISSYGNGDFLTLNLNQFNSETKEAPLWDLLHESLIDDNNELIENPVYNLSQEVYDKLGHSYFSHTECLSIDCENFAEYINKTIKEALEFFDEE